MGTGTSWCWTCDLEHQAWASACARCGGELHDEPPPVEVPASHDTVEIDLSGMEPSARDLFLLFLDGAGIHHDLRGLLLSIAASDEQRTRELLETITSDTLVEFDPAEPTDDTQWSRDMAAMLHPSAVLPPERVGDGGPVLAAPASPLRRVVAGALSGMAWALLILVLVMPAALAWPSLSEGPANFLLEQVLPLVLSVATVARWGWTPGMYVVDVRVVDAAGDRPGLPVSALRMLVFGWPLLLAWIVEPLPSTETAYGVITLVWFAGILVSIATHPEQRGWHDRVAGTWVVATEREFLPRR